MCEAIVVGCGITGSIVARYLAQERNLRVTIFERRGHIAGNLYDYVDESDILVQRYGPHIFHTGKERVHAYITRYADWNPFKLECMVEMNGKQTPSPFNFQTIDDYFCAEKAETIKVNIASAYPGQDMATIVDMLENANPVVKEYARFLYDNDYSRYTAKQWGISPSEIDLNVLRRVPVLFSYKTGYFNEPYEMMPEGGYTAFVRSILDHSNIEIRLNSDIMEHLRVEEERKLLLYNGTSFAGPVVYTGMLDQLFHMDKGLLPYRSLRFEWQTHPMDSYQAAPVVAYPQAKGYTRITEYKKLPVQQVKGRTTIAVEYPCQYDGGYNAEPYYPIPTQKNEQMYEIYRSRAAKIPNLIISGRLAEYRYYDMDQAIEAALRVCDTL